MKLLFATTNPAKIKAYKNKLEQRGIEVLTIKDLNINIKVDETGKNAIENAYIKAKSYYDIANVITIGMDNNLYIEGIPDELEPGAYVRRVNGKELNDEEMIEYYSNLASKYGGKLKAKWIFGMVMYNGKTAKEYSWYYQDFYLVDKASSKRNPGYPLNSISIDIVTNKYFVDIDTSNKDINNIEDNKVIDFIIESITDEDK